MLSIVWSLLPDNDWWALAVFLCKLNPIKAHWGIGSRPFSFERSATSPPQADHSWLGRLILILDGWAQSEGTACPPIQLLPRMPQVTLLWVQRMLPGQTQLSSGKDHPEPPGSWPVIWAWNEGTTLCSSLSSVLQSNTAWAQILTEPYINVTFYCSPSVSLYFLSYSSFLTQVLLQSIHQLWFG